MMLIAALLISLSPVQANQGGWKCSYEHIKKDRYSSGAKEVLISDTELKQTYQNRGHGFELSLEGTRLTFAANANGETKVVTQQVTRAWGKDQRPAVPNLSVEFKHGAKSTVTCK